MMVVVVVERECGRGSVRWGVPWSCGVALPVLTARATVLALWLQLATTSARRACGT